MPTPSVHLLIDGSNILHAWPDTRALTQRNRESAKALLIRRVSVLHDFSGWRVTVVFDGRGDAIQIETIGDSENFACIHTPAGATADDVIERLVARSASPATCLVATADQAERSTIEAAGATWCDPDELASRIGAADTQQSRAIARHNSATARSAKNPRP